MAPIVILMVLIVALGIYAPAPLYTLMDRATAVVNEGIPGAQTAASGLATSSVSTALDLWQAQPPSTFFGIGTGH